MALKEYQIICSITDIEATGDIIKFRAPFAGTIKEIHLWTDVANSNGDNVFNLNKNGSDLFAGGARPKIAQSATLGSKTGLSESVAFGDTLLLQLESMATGGVKAYLTLQIIFDDGDVPRVPDTNQPDPGTDTPSTTLGFPIRYDDSTGRIWVYDGTRWNYWARTGTLVSLASLSPWAYFEADNEPESHGANATGWDDMSGNGRHMTNGSTAPVKNIASGLHSFTFNAGGWFVFPSMSGVTSAEMFLVCQLDSGQTGANARLHGLSGAGTTDYYHPFSGTALYDGFFSTARKDNITAGVTLSNIHCLNIDSAASLWRMRTNGTERHNTTSNTISAPTAGKLGGNSGSGSYFGKVFALYMFNRVLDASERASMQAYINTKYGITFA